MNEWTMQDFKFVQDNYHKMTDKEMAKVINRTDKAIKEMRFVKGFRKGPRRKPKWTDAENKILWDNRHISIKKLSPLLPDYSSKQIYKQLDKMRADNPDKFDQPVEQYITDWKNYKPSYKSFEIPDDLKMTVKIQQMLAVRV